MNEQDREILNILKEAISIEIYGREYYSIFSDLVEGENAKSLFKGLSRDEGEHRQLLETQFLKVAGKSFDISKVDEVNREKAKSVFPESLEPLGIQETKDILKLGIRTEERSIELYSKSVDRTDNKSSKDLFSRLVLFETEHKKTLEDALYYLDQEGSWYGYSPPTIEG
ncbi:Rubrerythrin [uncultured archaeon]|nr:Rubrerythrin [uncultured archaeon]